VGGKRTFSGNVLEIGEVKSIGQGKKKKPVDQSDHHQVRREGNNQTIDRVLEFSPPKKRKRAPGVAEKKKKKQRPPKKKKGRQPK